MPRKKSLSNYFTADTDKWIIAYNASTSHVERDKIFREHLYYPFYKLSENIIHTFKFYYTEVNDIEDLKYEIISLVFQDKIMKFDPSKGAKAYSYFGTIIKRHLINYNNKNYNRIKKQIPIDTWDNHKEDNQYEILENTITLSQFIDIWTEETSNKIEHLFKFVDDQKVAHAIITLFQQREGIEIFNKKAIYMYVREMTGTSTQNLTPIVKELKRLFYLRLQDFQEQGMIQG